MKKEFKKFTSNIRLTENQENDGKTKSNSVCECVHKKYYETKYDEKTKLIFGSSKTKTNTRPLSKDQDVDTLFKIPKDVYERFLNHEGNGPSALLQEVKKTLEKTFSTTNTIKGWGKVVLVQFGENHHNVELLPAYELEDQTFLIPNTEEGGSWDEFDPRGQIKIFQDSNKTTNGLTADLARMFKTWIQETPTVHSNYKSYNLLNDIIDFLTTDYINGAEFLDYPSAIEGCFEFIKNNCSTSVNSQLQTATHRAKKAIGFFDEEKPKEASIEWRKIFGDEFPLVSANPVTENNTKVFSSPDSPYAK